MTRQEKYPDTNCFHYFNANPKNKVTSDCIIRAISTATGISYENVMKDLYELSVKTGYMLNDDKCYSTYLKILGWKKYKQPRKEDNTKYTGEEFCEYCEEYSDTTYVPYIRGNVIAHIGSHHMVAFMKEAHNKYRLYDIWNSLDGCIGNYWVKE